MIPSLIQKESLQVILTDIGVGTSIFHIVVWPPHASPFPRVHLRFRLWPLCSPLSMVIYSFCSLNIRSRFQTKSWSTLFSSSPFGSHDRSFDPSVVVEEPSSLFQTSAMGTSSFNITAFPRLVSFGAPCF